MVYFKTFEDHVSGMDGIDVHGAAFGADIGEVLAEEFVAALQAEEERFHFSQRQFGIPERGKFLFDDVEAELDVVATMAGEGVETDADAYYMAGLLGSGLFFDGFQDSADEMNFMHNSILGYETGGLSQWRKIKRAGGASSPEIGHRPPFVAEGRRNRDFNRGGGMGTMQRVQIRIAN